MDTVDNPKGAKTMAKSETIDVVGAKIVDIRPMTKKEKKEIGWDEDHMGTPKVVVFDNGMILAASQDEEGNGPGAFFGLTKSGAFFHIQ